MIAYIACQTGDEVTILLHPFGYESFQAMQESRAGRYQYLQDYYMRPLNAFLPEDIKAVENLWKKYQQEVACK